GLPLQALASVEPTARPEQSPLWPHLYRLSSPDRPPTWRQVPFRARAKSSQETCVGCPGSGNGTDRGKSDKDVWGAGYGGGVHRAQPPAAGTPPARARAG